jgi:hypothetical protein
LKHNSKTTHVASHAIIVVACKQILQAAANATFEIQAHKSTTLLKEDQSTNNANLTHQPMLLKTARLASQQWRKQSASSNLCQFKRQTNIAAQTTTNQERCISDTSTDAALIEGVSSEHWPASKLAGSSQLASKRYSNSAAQE